MSGSTDSNNSTPSGTPINEATIPGQTSGQSASRVILGRSWVIAIVATIMEIAMASVGPHSSARSGTMTNAPPNPVNPMSAPPSAAAVAA